MKIRNMFLILSLLINVGLYSTTDRLISRFERARPKLLDAQKYFNKGKLKKAEKAIKICLKRMPEYSEANYLLANIYLKKNMLNEALESSKSAINNYKYRYIVYRYFSDEQNSKNLNPSSEEIRLREEKKQRIKNIEARYHFQCGNIYYKLKKFQDAFKQYSKAIKINPEYGDAYNNMASLFLMAKQYKNALEYLKKARDRGVKINPKFEAYLKKKLGL